MFCQDLLQENLAALDFGTPEFGMIYALEVQLWCQTMDPTELLPRIPDLSWAEPMAREALGMIRSLREEFPKIYQAGFRDGAVITSLGFICSILLSLFFRKPQ